MPDIDVPVEKKPDEKPPEEKKPDPPKPEEKKPDPPTDPSAIWREQGERIKRLEEKVEGKKDATGGLFGWLKKDV